MSSAKPSSSTPHRSNNAERVQARRHTRGATTTDRSRALQHERGQDRVQHAASRKPRSTCSPAANADHRASDDFRVVPPAYVLKASNQSYPRVSRSIRRESERPKEYLGQTGSDREHFQHGDGGELGHFAAEKRRD